MKFHIPPSPIDLEGCILLAGKHLWRSGLLHKGLTNACILPLPLTHFLLQVPSVAITQCQKCTLSHQVWKALLFMIFIFLITSFPSHCSASGIWSINHFTVTCAKVSLDVHLPHYHQQTKIHWLRILEQTVLLAFHYDCFLSLFTLFFLMSANQSQSSVLFLSSDIFCCINLSCKHTINNITVISRP